MKNLMCAEAKQIDLVNYLASLGHLPQIVRNQDYWYLSPLREEKTPSFKVNRRLNVWYDYGTGKGGNLVDFGILYFNCNIADLLQRLTWAPPTFSFHPPSLTSSQRPAPTSFAGEKKDTPESKIVILDARQLADKSLLAYFQKRFIPLEIANRFCKEIDFLLYGKKHTAIGFQNSAGGYELRNENFKGSSAPKDVTFVDNHTDQIVVFEGFFSFLSFCAINKNQPTPLTNCLILNSLSFFERTSPLMGRHKQVHLFLDRDNAGIRYTRQAIQADKNKYIDRSDYYHNRKDLNDWLIHHHQSKKASQRIRKWF